MGELKEKVVQGDRLLNRIEVFWEVSFTNQENLGKKNDWYWEGARSIEYHISVKVQCCEMAMAVDASDWFVSRRQHSRGRMRHTKA